MCEKIILNRYTNPLQSKVQDILNRSVIWKYFHSNATENLIITCSSVHDVISEWNVIYIYPIQIFSGHGAVVVCLYDMRARFYGLF